MAVMKRDDAEDGELLELAVQGDDVAFATLYRRHLPAVLAYLRPRVPSAELAFDLAAETFAAVALQAVRFRGEGTVVAWIYGIAHHKLLESLRRGRVEAAARERLRFEPIVLDDADLAAVEDRCSAGATDLDHHLAQLPAEQREALLARVVDEEPYDKIAARLGCSQQVVRQRVHRGLRRLRQTIEEPS